MGLQSLGGGLEEDEGGQEDPGDLSGNLFVSMQGNAAARGAKLPLQTGIRHLEG